MSTLPGMPAVFSKIRESVSLARSYWRLFIFLSVVTALLGLVTLLSFRAITQQVAAEPEDIPLGLYAEPKPVKTRSRSGSFMKLANINFRVSNKISIYVKSLEGEAVPTKPKGLLNFDDVNSFTLDIYQAEIFMAPRVLEVVFNDIVFNYEGAPLKDLKMSFVDGVHEGKKTKKLKLTGRMKAPMGLWPRFEQIGRMRYDQERALMVMEADKIKIIGGIPVKDMMGAVGLKLGNFVKVPRGRGIHISGNKIYIQPFALFPPPRFGGYISELRVIDNMLYLKFDNDYKVKFPRRPNPRAQNYVFLHKGDVRFGRMSMIDAKVQLVDADPTDPFDFYMKRYFDAVVRGRAELKRDGAIVMTVPDFADL